MVDLLARTVRGIEWVAAAEARAALGADVAALGHREVRFGVPGLSPALLELGTVDDVFLLAGEIPGVGRVRADLERVRAGAAALDVGAAPAGLRALRPVPEPVDFDVVASFLGRRNFNRFELEDALGGGVEAATGWTYRSRAGGQVPPPTALTLRVHLVEDVATVGVRVAERPLHRRAYKTAAQPGTLHPPLARAMALVAGILPDASILDPFAGSGTICIEAALAALAGRVGGPVETGARAQVRGIDIRPESIARARELAAAAGVEASFGVGDAAVLPLPSDSVDRVITNPPWGLATRPAGGLATSLEPAWREAARVLTPTGRLVVLAPDAAAARSMAAASGLSVVLENPVRLSGQHALLTALARASADPIDATAVVGRELAAAQAKIGPVRA